MMLYFKDANDGFYVISDPELVRFLPRGFTQITAQEYAEQQASFEPKAMVLKTIIGLEVANPITHRTLREVILAMGLVVQQVTGKPAAANPYYVKLAALNAQIDAMAESIRTAP